MKFKGTQIGHINQPPPTHDCEWSPYGVLQRKPTFVYHKPIYPEHPEWNITWVLGTIKLRTDGRWSWWRQLSPHWPAWQVGQGVALTKMGAMYDVQEGWTPQDILRLFPTTSCLMADVYEYSQDVRQNDPWFKRKVVLGRVIDTHTGVWTWVRHKSKYHPEWKPGRGTSASCQLAHQNLWMVGDDSR